MNAPNEPKGNPQINAQFCGRGFDAAVRCIVDGKSVLVSKIDLAKADARDRFIESIVERLASVDTKFVEEELLKQIDQRASSLEKSQAIGSGSDRADQPTTVDLMVQIALNEADLHHDSEQAAYATIEIGQHMEHMRVESKKIRLWLRRRFQEDYGRSAAAEAVTTTIEECESRAVFAGKKIEVHVRVAEQNCEYLIDLADDSWCTMYLVAYWTGLRRGELKKIVWADIDDHALRVRHGIGKAKREDWVALRDEMVAAVEAQRPVDSRPADRIFSALSRIESFHRDCATARVGWINTAPDSVERENRERFDCLKRYDARDASWICTSFARRSPLTWPRTRWPPRWSGRSYATRTCGLR